MNKKLAIFILLILSLLIAGPVMADADNRAGLVIVFGDGTVHTECISFSQQQITGFELLERSELEYLTGFDPGAGAAVCSVEGEGCGENDCFCDYPKYWTYWHLEAGEWVYSQIGTSSWLIKNGSVDAWKWGVGAQPPDISFEQICGLPEQQETDTDHIASPSPSKTAQGTDNYITGTTNIDDLEISDDSKSITAPHTSESNHQNSSALADQSKKDIQANDQVITSTDESEEIAVNPSTDPDNALVIFGVVTILLGGVFLVIIVQNKS